MRAVKEPPLEPGTRVRNQRKLAGYTQEDLAKLVAVSRQTIISMETGSYAPSVYLALKVAQILKSTVEALWGPGHFENVSAQLPHLPLGPLLKLAGFFSGC
jgi:putative transcriptional regulator